MRVQDQDPWPEGSEKQLHGKRRLCFIFSSVVCSLLMEKPTVPELICLLSSQDPYGLHEGSHSCPLSRCHSHLPRETPGHCHSLYLLMALPREEVKIKFIEFIKDRVLRKKYLCRNPCPGKSDGVGEMEVAGAFNLVRW
uniref:Uncharacterized protein n=1 Tax=Molossus molossus TaxID=27622 RepID=A0A7J8I0Z3_MOLMO|nr:hypothetical protein HJG59_010840 [Molossus molossus]